MRAAPGALKSAVERALSDSAVYYSEEACSARLFFLTLHTVGLG